MSNDVDGPTIAVWPLLSLRHLSKAKLRALSEPVVIAGHQKDPIAVLVPWSVFTHMQTLLEAYLETIK